MKYIIILTTLLMSLNIFAQRNPQIRVCNISGGLFWSVYVNEDNVGFCKYGESMVGSITLMQHFFYNQNTQAMDALFKTAQGNVNNCGTLGASELLSIDSEGDYRDMCLFNDGSYLLKRTLTEGFNSKFNERLRQAL